jgi:hypothetical protein
VLTADLTSIPRPSSPPRVLSHLGIVEGTNVTIPWLEARLASVPDLSMYDPRVQPLFDWANWTDNTLAVALRVRYVWPGIGKRIAFWGPVHTPDFDYETGKVTINARDPSLRMERGFVTKGDDLISPGYTVDGRGARQIVSAAQNRENQDALDWPSLGINPGFDFSTPEHSIFRRATRGDQLWDTLKQLAALEIGPDFELEPYETDPTNVADGPVTDNTDQNVPAGATTDYTLNSGLTDVIEGFRVGVFVRHQHPSQLDMWLLHPDGTTIQLYDGTRSNKPKKTTASPYNAFGTAEGDLAFFADLGKWPYGTRLNPDSWPKTGQFKSEDPLLAALNGKTAGGTWKLRIRNRGAAAGTLAAWSLRFQLPDPAYCRLNTYDKPPENPAMDAKFFDGTGANNARIKVSPLGESTANWARFGSGQGAQSEAIRQDSAARNKIGTYEDWQSTDQADGEDVLAQLAARWVAAYGLPAPALTIKPNDDRGQLNLPRLLFDYKVGGHVLGVAKKGYARHRVPARVVQGVLRNAGKTVQTDLNVIPVVGIPTEDA